MAKTDERVYTMRCQDKYTSTKAWSNAKAGGFHVEENVNNEKCVSHLQGNNTASIATTKAINRGFARVT